MPPMRWWLILAGSATLAVTAAAQSRPVDHELLRQRAIAQARRLLEQNRPADAVQVLEDALAAGDGDATFLEWLDQAYQAELRMLEQAGQGISERARQLRRYIELLRPSVRQDPSGRDDALQQAVVAFQQRRYAEAAGLFARADPQQQEHRIAWAYCRIHQAVERWKGRRGNPAHAAEIAAELRAAASQLPPQHPLRDYVDQLLRQIGTAVEPSAAATPKNEAAATQLPVGAEAAGTPVAASLAASSFRVYGPLSTSELQAVAAQAEEWRRAIFEMWSGPPAGAWSPPCEIVLHADGSSFTQQTRLPPEHASLARVELADGKVLRRRIDIRIDRPDWQKVLLPRELCHVVLADLFPTALPRWAAEGMAGHLLPAAERERYYRTLARCIRDQQTIPLAQLLSMQECPPQQVTAFCCQSVVLAELLIRRGGERNFTIFLRDAQRYGWEAAVRRQYGYGSLRELEQALLASVAVPVVPPPASPPAASQGHAAPTTATPAAAVQYVRP